MLDILLTVAAVWLIWQVLKLSFRVAWGLAKVLGVILAVLALPVLLAIVFSAGGALLLLPFGMIAAAFGLIGAGS